MPDLSSSLRDLIEQSARPFDVDAIVQVRRRRRSARRISVAGAVVLVVAVVTGSVLARPTNEPKIVSVGGSGDAASAAADAGATRSALAGITIVSPGGGSPASETFASAPQVHLTDPLSGSTRAIPFPVPGVRGWTVPFFALGSHVVMMVDQVGPEFPVLPSGQPLQLAFVASSTFGEWQSITGPVTSVFAATSPNAVWTVDDGYVTEASWTAVPFGGPYRLTRGRVPFAAVGDGLLTARPSGSRSAPEIYEVWDPKTGRAVRQLAISAPPLAVSSSYAAWLAVNCAPASACPLHLTDVRTGGDRVVAPPRGMQWSAGAAFSPDGSQLAALASAPPSRQDIERDSLVPPPGSRAVDVAIVDVASGSETTRSATVWKGALNPQWSPDGSLVFFTSDATHVGYLNSAHRDRSAQAVRVPKADSYLIVAKPAPPSAPVATQHWSYDGQVVGDRLHSPELCIYATTADLSPYSDGCSGPLVVGWHSPKPSGTFHLVGTYDGQVFTLTEPPNTPVTTTVPTPSPTSAPPSTPTPAPTGFPSGCPTPSGGWRITDPARVTFATYTAVTDAAQREPGYVSTWVGPYTSLPGVISTTLPVLNFAFTANLDAHRQVLSAIYGGPICVVQRGTHTESELQSIVQQLFGQYGRDLGLQMLSGGPDAFDGAVTVEAIAVTPAQRAAVNRRFGAGVVHLNSRLTPLP